MPQRPFLMAREGDLQPARTSPEQDEVGKGRSGRSSNVPIRRQLAALARTTAPQESGSMTSMDAIANLLSALRSSG